MFNQFGPIIVTLYNEFQQAIGFSVDDWQACPWPERETIEGQYCQLEVLDATRHGADLYREFGAASDAADWTYLPYGPFTNSDVFVTWLHGLSAGADPLFYAIVDKASGKAVGMASYLRIDPANGAIEVGHIHFSRRLQKTPLATEAMYLMMKQIFDLGYRRYEWKCDAYNAPSCKAAKRLGFTYEGLFRQAVIYKNRNRDTAWFAIVNEDWQAMQARFEAWLDASNFDVKGAQIRRLEDC
jgi:RimJ/RimL family protein N-acetyltransferase